MRALARRVIASLILLAGGCDDDDVIRDYGAQFCSVDPQDDPQYHCKQPLVCVNTYAERVRNADGGTATAIPIFLCREPCAAERRCPGGEVCCDGRGTQGQALSVCVPEARCQLVRDQ